MGRYTEASNKLVFLKQDKKGGRKVKKFFSEIIFPLLIFLLLMSVAFLIIVKSGDLFGCVLVIFVSGTGTFCFLAMPHKKWLVLAGFIAGVPLIAFIVMRITSASPIVFANIPVGILIVIYVKKFG